MNAHLSSRSEPRRAFSLIELLLVVALIAILSLLAVPAFISISRGSGMKQAINGVSDALEMARTDAMASSTWIWVGLADGTADNPSQTPQIVIARVASRDGTTNTDTTNLTQLAPPVRFANVAVLQSPTSWGTNVSVAKNSAFQFAIRVAGQTKTFSNNVIGFSPQGEAVLNTATVSPWLEVGLQEMRGSTPITNKTASIQIAGVSGQVVVTY